VIEVTSPVSNLVEILNGSSLAVSSETTNLLQIEDGPTLNVESGKVNIVQVEKESTLAVTSETVNLLEVALQGPPGPAGPNSIDDFTTDDLDEGNQNLYYTDERVDDRVAALLQAGTNITLTYDDVNDTLTVDAAGGGVTDHGALLGLADDDHPQYAQHAAAETISAAWLFTGQPTVQNTALVLDNDGGVVLSLPDAIGTGQRTVYTFSLGGGADADAATDEGGETIFKMSDINSNSLSGNELVFDLGRTSSSLDANTKSSFFTLQSRRIFDDVRKVQVEFAPSAGVNPGPLGFRFRNEGGSGGSSASEFDMFFLNDSGNSLTGKNILFQTGDGAGAVADRLRIGDTSEFSFPNLIDPVNLASLLLNQQAAAVFSGNHAGETWASFRIEGLNIPFFGGTPPDIAAVLHLPVPPSGATKNLGILDDSGVDWEMQGNLEAASYSAGGLAGASGTFTAQSGETVTVTNGIVTDIS
jgi:hypothetical protein